MGGKIKFFPFLSYHKLYKSGEKIKLSPFLLGNVTRTLYLSNLGHEQNALFFLEKDLLLFTLKVVHIKS